jgi:hypothetical protein
MKTLVALLFFVLSIQAKPHYRNITVDTLILTCDTVTSADYVLVKTVDDTIRCIHIDSVGGSGSGFIGTINDMYVPYYISAGDSFSSSPIYVNALGSASTDAEFGISTATPDSILTVDGSGHFDGNVFVNGNLGVSTNSPIAALDISYGGMSLCLGGDVASTSRTNNTTKYSRIAAAHYDNAEQPLAILYSVSNATSNALYFGGGTGWCNAATEVRFYTGATNITTTGTERVRITSDGKFGIGISIPDSLLTISGSGHISGRMRVDQKIGIATNEPDSELTVNGASNIKGNAYFGSFVGIGNNNPTEQLDISGINARIVIADTTVGDNSELIEGIAVGSGAFLNMLDEAGVLSASITSYGNSFFTGGNVGVGSNTPDSTLTVSGSGNFSGNVRINGNLGVGVNATSAKLHVNSGSDDAVAYLESASSNARVVLKDASSTQYMVTENSVLSLGTNNSYASFDGNLNIDQYGSVGIGTKSPDEMFHVSAGNILLDNNYEIRQKDGGGTERTVISLTSSNLLNIGTSAGSMAFITGSGSYDEKMRIGTNGHVGINTETPDSLLTVIGSSYLSSNARFGTNVGIRTNSPQAPLDVSYGALGLLLGADNATNTRTNSTSKYARFAFPHYNNAEQTCQFLYGLSSSSENIVHVGGGSATCNAATSIQFYTAANNTTLQGSQRMHIASDGNVGINIDDPDEKLHIDGASARIKITDEVHEASQNLIGVSGGNGAFISMYDDGGVNNTVIRTYGNTFFDGGNVGIGEVLPDSLLTVDGGCMINNDMLVKGKLKLSSLSNSDGRITYIDTDSSINTSLMLYNETFGHLSLPGNVLFPLYQGDYSKGLIVNTVDGNDTGSIYMSSCGALAWRRGAGIQMYGSDYDDINYAGRVSIRSAQSSSHSGPASELVVRQGEIIFYLDTIHGAPYLDVTASGTNVVLTGASTMQIGVTGNTDILQIFSNGITTGNPSGGAMGDGTINAKALYDDGSLVSGYPLDYKYNRNFSIKRWDSLGTNNVHKPARDFINKRVSTLDIDSFCVHIRKERTLPALDESEKSGKRLSTGESIQKLTETIEVMAIHISELNERIKALEKE